MNEVRIISAILFEWQRSSCLSLKNLLTLSCESNFICSVLILSGILFDSRMSNISLILFLDDTFVGIEDVIDADTEAGTETVIGSERGTAGTLIAKFIAGMATSLSSCTEQAVERLAEFLAMFILGWFTFVFSAITAKPRRPRALKRLVECIMVKK